MGIVLPPRRASLSPPANPRRQWPANDADPRIAVTPTRPASSRTSHRPRGADILPLSPDPAGRSRAVSGDPEEDRRMGAGEASGRDGPAVPVRAEGGVGPVPGPSLAA